MSAPGWYPDPYGGGGQRYFDGAAWTPHAVPPPMPHLGPQVVVVQSQPRVNHLLHLILTLLTCGLWAPIWIILAIVDVATRKTP
ncbi:DUF2510 domain-containing protein [Mycobacteroides abscessus subsp. abscessus]|uniref:DUF2510 domain-containing protein n=1 Tax=Mycobacteroides abscessus TaxID=36809 RepID=UPI0039EEB45B